MMKSTMRLLIPGVLYVLGVVISAEDAAACQRCADGMKVVLSGGGSWCEPLREGETGVTICKQGVDIFGKPWCTESGTFCSQITVDGGGGSGGGTGGGGGGGGGSCQGAGFCPAECFSCSGGGVRN